MDTIISNAMPKLDKAIANLQEGLKGIRTGAANPNMLSKVEVEYYGTLTPLNQVAGITVVEGRQLYVKPYDPSLVKEIEKSIFAANLGLTPQNESNAIRINVPQLTEERRKEYVKQAGKYSEEAKVAVRAIRRDVVDAIRKDKTVPEDLRKANETEMNNLTEKYCGQIDDILERKTKDIMNI